MTTAELVEALEKLIAAADEAIYAWAEGEEELTIDPEMRALADAIRDYYRVRPVQEEAR